MSRAAAALAMGGVCESRSGVVLDATNGYQKILERSDFGLQIHPGVEGVEGCKNMQRNE